MPLYMYIVRNQKVRFPLRAVVAIPRGIVKVRFKTILWDGGDKHMCSTVNYMAERSHRFSGVVAIFWKDDGTLISQTVVTANDTEIPVPSGTAYVEWRTAPNAVYTSDILGQGLHYASISQHVPIMSFIDEANNITNVYIDLTFICSCWDAPVSTASSTVPINVDIPFCSDCTGDFSVRSALRGIYAMVKNSQNAKLQAVLLDLNKNVLASCPEQAVGDISSDTEIWLCPDNDPDLVTYLKVNYPNTRYIRVKIDKSNPAGPLPAAIFTIYFSVDKGSIP